MSLLVSYKGDLKILTLFGPGHAEGDDGGGALLLVPAPGALAGGLLDALDHGSLDRHLEAHGQHQHEHRQQHVEQQHAHHGQAC